VVTSQIENWHPRTVTPGCCPRVSTANELRRTGESCASTFLALEVSYAGKGAGYRQHTRRRMVRTGRSDLRSGLE
jgi:hypothetical protein